MLGPNQVNWCPEVRRGDWSNLFWIGWGMLALGLCLAGPASGQLSPGALSRSHRDLDGPTQCTKCHEFGVADPGFKCTECHLEIQKLVEDGHGYHARVADLSENGRDCVTCHGEHYGRDFQPVHFSDGREKFNHVETGYVLRGKHATLTCNQCHTTDNIAPGEMDLIQVKDRTRTLIGLSQECLACHADEHRNQLGTDCKDCHTEKAQTWKEPEWFDHATTRYQLNGKHESVACVKCHAPIGSTEKYTRYVGLDAKNCESCHRDEHRKAFSEGCETCHTTTGWKQPETAGRVDHSKTGFPLEGKHATTACGKCHAGVDFSQPLAHGRCLDCHRDTHQEQFLSRSDGGDCRACHTQESFVPASYGMEEHQRSAYSLTGKHEKLECTKCHKPAGEQTRYRISHESCQDCHEDAHDGEFMNSSQHGRCVDCHETDHFAPSTFTVARHQETKFGLRGSHVAVACVQCHESLGKTDSRSVDLRYPDLTCTGCHEDPHRNQFSTAALSDGVTLECQTCHTDRSWSRLLDLDHARTGFELVGAHRQVACLGCHRPPANAAQFTGKPIVRIVFRDAPTKCAGCHEDVHAGQFEAGESARECTACHTNVDWKPTDFDHDRYSTFSLKGAHERVPCGDCHAKRQLASGPVTVYRGTPQDCAACHGPEDALVTRRQP